MKLTKKDLLSLMRSPSLVIIGTLVLAFGTAVFILPMRIVSGGISGLAILLKLLIPSDAVSMDLIVSLLTWGLFLVGLAVLGRAFALKTLLSTLLYPPAVSLFLRLTDPSVCNGFFALASSPHGELAFILSAAMGGVLVGTGCALTFIGGGSTGGVDIIAFTVCRLFPRFKSSTVLFIIDTLTVTLGMLVIGDLVISLLGILSAFVSAVMVDRVLLGGRAAFVAHIVTEHPEEINRHIIRRLERSSTIVDATGGYSGNGKKLMIVSFTVSQYAEILFAVSRYDPRAFVMIHRAHEISGEGWREIV